MNTRTDRIPTLPTIIQGGMGIAVSDWRLANAVGRTGQLGVVSGTAIDTVFVRRLQDGDPGGNMRRALEHFPLHAAAEDALRTYYRPGGRTVGEPYALLPMYRQVMSRTRQEITIMAAFVETFLAKEGHPSPVGINLLTKVQMPTLPTLYGAMLAGVDCVLMGAGIPRGIPGALDLLAEHRPAQLRFDVEGLPAGAVEFLEFDPGEFWDTLPAPLYRPQFLPIVASNSLSTMLARKANGRIDGFVIEGATGGGHNAPPRGAPRFNPRGEPVYGERDEVNLAQMQELGLPFWIAGGAGHPERLAAARAAGAAGVQVGTLFAYCEESGLDDSLKRDVLRRAASGDIDIRTDLRASPTGYPFKIVTWPGNPDAGATRERICDLGYLRVGFVTGNGSIDYRCAGEPEIAYVRKGGHIEDTAGRRCLCNALLADIGLPQTRLDTIEQPLLTSGEDLITLGEFLKGRTSYTAADVVKYLLGQDA